MGKINPKKHIIVIGNSPSVLGFEAGKIIDSFGQVVRFNNYQTYGFEKFVGSKTTIWARSNSKQTLERPNLKQYQRVIICSPAWNMPSAMKLSKKIPRSEVVPHKIALDLEVSMGFNKKNKKALPSRKQWPSSGILLIDYLLRSYNIIYVHGFDFFQHNGKSPRHYYNNLESIKASAHNSDKEKMWIENKISEGKLRWFHNDVQKMISLKKIIK